VTTRSAEKAHAFAGRADVAVIDFDQPDTVRAAFHGSRKAFVGLGTSGRQVQDEVALIDAAVAAGVQHIVKLSVLGSGSDFPVIIQQIHTEIERHVLATGVGYTLLRPATYFRAVVTTPARFIASGRWGGNTAGGRAAFIDPTDVGLVAARVLRNPSSHYLDQILDLTGPASLSMTDVAPAVSRQLGRQIAYQERSESDQTAVLNAAGLNPAVVDIFPGLNRMTRDNLMADIDPAAATILGRTPTTLAEWLDAADLSSLDPQ